MQTKGKEERGKSEKGAANEKESRTHRNRLFSISFKSLPSMPNANIIRYVQII